MIDLKKLKIGDKVICNHTIDDCYDKGKIYTISSLRNDNLFYFKETGPKFFASNKFFDPFPNFDEIEALKSQIKELEAVDKIRKISIELALISIENKNSDLSNRDAECEFWFLKFFRLWSSAHPPTALNIMSVDVILEILKKQEVIGHETSKADR